VSLSPAHDVFLSPAHEASLSYVHDPSMVLVHSASVNPAQDRTRISPRIAHGGIPILFKWTKQKGDIMRAEKKVVVVTVDGNKHPASIFCLHVLFFFFFPFLNDYVFLFPIRYL
jgi:hypothetical protein